MAILAEFDRMARDIVRDGLEPQLHAVDLEPRPRVVFDQLERILDQGLAAPGPAQAAQAVAEPGGPVQLRRRVPVG